MSVEKLRGIKFYRHLLQWAAAELEAASNPSPYTPRNQLECAKKIRECLILKRWEK
jgi:hypothetical protein